jgi:hypothetical protein
MKDTKIIAAIIISLGMVISTYLLAESITSFGHSMENACNHISRGMSNSSSNTPRHYDVNFKCDGGTPITINTKSQ